MPLAATRTRDAVRTVPAWARHLPDLFCWLLPVLLLLGQLLLVERVSFQVRYEELAEAVRNPYWFGEGLIYDGVSSNVGWYGLLHHAYSIFGFDLFAGRYVKVALYFVALLGLSRIARRHLGVGPSLILLLAVGLSPAYLYFSAMMTSFGIDLSYALIWLWVIDRMNWNGGVVEFVMALGAWSLAMIACMSYPSFVPYLPSAAGLYAYLLWSSRAKRPGRWTTAYLFAAAIGLLIPAAAARFTFGPQLFFDPYKSSGLLRGGGRLSFDFADIAASVEVSLRDLFGVGDSFYYELARPDFASALAIAALCATGVGVLLSFVRDEKRRVPIALAILLAVAGLLVPNLAPNHPGLRRATAFLFAVHLLYALALAELVRSREIPKWARRISIGALMLLPISHGVGYYESFSHVPTPSRHHFGRWFAAKGTPRDSLAHWLEFTERERFLPACAQAYSLPDPRCRYAEIFAALSGHRRWNGEAPLPIEIADPVSGERIELTTDLWVSHRFEH